ncbi:MAG: hypothetical protein VBE63_15345 [Lamprobacter sp.]|uniref:hypothetical protein n=1 Tax=Lamprobacter sp. TaxID=3100796 RepID=UPI002B25E7F6|nr:hypothetical protein [Lamprobacter sp.]MEA3641299.1 hypothetical protein [Lamprobacter sp.]
MTEDYFRQTVQERLQDHEQRLRLLEREVRDNTIVVRSARWVAVVVGGSALTMIATLIFEKVSA